jgi:hypothetical protein
MSTVERAVATRKPAKLREMTVVSYRPRKGDVTDKCFNLRDFALAVVADKMTVGSYRSDKAA